MLINSDLTIYHITTNDVTKLEQYEKHYYKKVWCYLVESATLNKGVEKQNNITIRIPYELNPGLNIEDMAKNDIVIQGNQENITSAIDLMDKEFYRITSITNNTYGSNKHIHIKGQ